MALTNSSNGRVLAIYRLMMGFYGTVESVISGLLNVAWQLLGPRLQEFVGFFS